MARRTQWWYVIRTEPGGRVVQTRHRLRRALLRKVGWLMGQGVTNIEVRDSPRLIHIKLPQRKVTRFR